jgi:5-methylcytosine-specific restriction enzyme subunit McrC
VSDAAVERVQPEPRRIGGIPIRNLYIMLAFADTLRNELSAATCGAMENEAFPLDILAQLLLNKLIWIRRRGMPRSYRVRDDVNAAPEGPLDLPSTLRGMHLVHNRLAFVVDELQMDTPHNRLLCTGVRVLLRADGVKHELALELRRQLAVFSAVSYISTTEALRVPWDRCPGAPESYREALGLARLAVLATLPDEGAHDRHWRKLLDDQQRMGNLFEEFLRGFFEYRFDGRGSVPKEKFKWMQNDPSGLLPSLETDLFIKQPGRVTVGECKLYKSPLGKSRSGADRLQREHLFQLYTYLRAAQERYPDCEVEGLLIYALVDRCFDTDVRLREHPVRVRTLDLNLDWLKLREQLVGLWPR